MPYKNPDQRRIYQRAWAAKARSENPQLAMNKKRHRQRAAAKYIRSIKDGQTCVDCGIRYPHFVLQFDHVGDNKEYEIGRMANGGYSIKTIAEEVMKCELVCANCHAIRTYERRIDKMAFPQGIEP